MYRRNSTIPNSPSLPKLSWGPALNPEQILIEPKRVEQSDSNTDVVPEHAARASLSGRAPIGHFADDHGASEAGVIPLVLKGDSTLGLIRSHTSRKQRRQNLNPGLCSQALCSMLLASL